MPTLPFALSFLTLALCQEDALPAADPAVTRAELEHHVRFLASDELAGRARGTPGMERASQYLAKALAAAGVEPAGDEGSFFQATGMKRYDYPSVPRLLFTDESGAVQEARYGADFTLRVRGTARSTEKLQLRFFYDYNHERMPLEGNPAEALHFSASKSAKQRILAEKGIANLNDWGLEIDVSRMEGGGVAGQLRESMPARFASQDEPEACELIELRGPLCADFARRKFTHVQLLVEERQQPFRDCNVVGRMRGAGTSARPELAQEVVILSAHYDHLGIRPPPRGREREDSLYNGADDDASGCAALLELAQSLGAGKKPARTLVFLFTTGEESGGAGSARYLARPSEPLARTVADLNLEMLGRPDDALGGPGRLWLTGYERSNLGSTWQAQGLAIVADPRPDERFFSRSDNYAFALEGVVAQSLSSFGLHKDYHSPRDEADTLDYAHLEAVTRLALQAATTLADGSLQPAWVEGQRPKKAAPRDAKDGEAGERGQRRPGAGGGEKDDGPEDDKDG